MPCKNSTSEFFCKLKNILHSKKTKTILVVLVLACIFFINAESASAAGVMDSLLKFLADNTIGALLLQIQNFMVLLVSVATTILEAVMNPDIISGDTGIFNRDAVKNIWVMVRDIGNMFFILVLLFSAFCTIFQVEKWNLKKTWLSILINALLVNFSYPIARFFIDISNVAMYYFLNNMFTSSLASGSKATGSTIAGSFGTYSKISQIMTPDGFASLPLTFELMIIAFTFIFAVTLLILGVLFLIRIIALTILIMFSPIGFVGFIFPSTQKFASDWWGKLFNYAFFGPIMVFMLVVALAITKAMGDDENTFLKAATANTTPVSNISKFVANASFFMIPIVVLWFGMGVAKSFGIIGADAVVGAGQKFAKWGLRGLSGMTAAAGVYKGYRAGRDKAKEESNFSANRLGGILSRKKDQAFSKLPIVGGGAKKNFESAEAARVAEEAKRLNLADKGDNELKDMSENGNKFSQAAAAAELANRGKTNGTAELDKVRELFGEDSQVFKQMQNKVKAYDPASAFTKTVTNEDGSTTKQLDTAAVEKHLKSNQYDEKKLSPEALGNPEFLALAMQHGGLNEKGLRNLAEKSQEYKTKIEGSIGTLASSSAHSDTTVESNRQIHLAHFESTGQLSGSLNTPEQRAAVIKGFNKDNTKKMEFHNLPKSHRDEILQNVNSGKVKEIVSNMHSEESKQAFVRQIESKQGDSPRARALYNQVQNDPYMKSFLEVQSSSSGTSSS